MTLHLKTRKGQPIYTAGDIDTCHRLARLFDVTELTAEQWDSVRHMFQNHAVHIVDERSRA